MIKLTCARYDMELVLNNTEIESMQVSPRAPNWLVITTHCGSKYHVKDTKPLVLKKIEQAEEDYFVRTANAQKEYEKIIAAKNYTGPE